MSKNQNFEDVLQDINRKYISLPDDEVKRSNIILGDVTDKISNLMKDDAIFAALYTRIFYGGSYYDGLKVGSPEEFDLDFILQMPQAGNHVLEHTVEPGYLSVRFMAPGQLSREFKDKMLDNANYFSAKKVRDWMKSVFSIALNKLLRNGVYNGPGYRLNAATSESGPAMTLILDARIVKINIDFVPCFELVRWPQGFRPNPVPAKKACYIVPKSPKHKNVADRYWRLSFQEQERELLHEERTLKPTLKLLKRLRDVQQHDAIASYYIKTIFLLQNEKYGTAYWNGTMTNTFFKMLDIYIQYIQSGNIPYFWNRQNNLLKDVPRTTLSNIAHRLHIIKTELSQKYLVQPDVICKFLDAKI